MSEQDTNMQDEISICQLIYYSILTGLLLFPIALYAIYPPIHDNQLLLFVIALFCITFFIISGMQKNPCENNKEKN